MSATTSEAAVREGDLALALRLLQDQVRARPAEARPRIFLFQLLCVMGQWERAQNQLAVTGELDAGCLPMVQTYREAIRCEAVRDAVFAGRKTPLLLGEPAEWVALLIEALALEAAGEAGRAAEMRAQAFDAAPASSGAIDEQAFAWIADADMRLGPVLEAVVDGKYYWVPVQHLARVEVEPPADLRDCVWTPARLAFVNGGEAVALLPTRYAGTDLSAAPLALARRTDWHEVHPGVFRGAGQRLFATDAGDRALLDTRTVVFEG